MLSQSAPGLLADWFHYVRITDALRKDTWELVLSRVLWRGMSNVDKHLILVVNEGPEEFCFWVNNLKSGISNVSPRRHESHIFQALSIRNSYYFYSRLCPQLCKWTEVLNSKWEWIWPPPLHFLSAKCKNWFRVPQFRHFRMFAHSLKTKTSHKHNRPTTVNINAWKIFLVLGCKLMLQGPACSTELFLPFPRVSSSSLPHPQELILLHKDNQCYSFLSPVEPKHKNKNPWPSQCNMWTTVQRKLRCIYSIPRNFKITLILRLNSVIYRCRYMICVYSCVM